MDSQHDNFILGRGEKLTDTIELASSPVDKIPPYTVNEAERRLEPQFEDAVRKLDELPDLACPDGQTVAALTLHPEYIAKSYYPEQLLQQLGVEQVGSKATLIKPDKWAKQKAPEAVRSVTLFVRGSRESFREIPQKMREVKGLGKATDELIKIEQVEPISDVERVKPITSKAAKVRLEVVLHASADAKDGFVVKGFKRYVESLGLSVDTNRRLYADGLCFMSMDAPKGKISDISTFSFVRVVREMPQLRPITRSNTKKFKLKLPSAAPVDPSVKVAVFDGGVPDKTPIDPWVRPHDTPGVGAAHRGYLFHGVAVTGALLFGPLSPDETASAPYCYVDHYRVLDTQTGADGEDILDVLKRIQDVLESTNYGFVNISLGPNMPVDDDEPHAWTTILDHLFVEQGILAAVAVGNSGHEDKASGNARIQPPADCVNAMSIGAADSQGDMWKRAGYSSIGPGRAPGIIKPDMVAFGGSDDLSDEPFNVVDAFGGGMSAATSGTSFSSPAALRTALGVRAHFGEVLTPIALKALLLHMADDGGHDRTEVGWGRIPLDFRQLMSTPDHAVRVLYQGVLSPAETIRAPIPLPFGDLQGMVEIKASVAYLTPTTAQDSANYTSAGLDIVFRPHDGKKKDPDQRHPDSKSFFGKGDYELYDDPLSHKAHTWETTRSNKRNMQAKSLKEPCFNLHYNARDGVGAAGTGAKQIRYAMVVTVTAPKHKDLYNQVLSRYRAKLEPIRPVVQIPVRA